jgi:hypothetical protein
MKSRRRSARRRHGPSRFRPGEGRWSRWAGQLRSRHERLAERHAFLATTFLHRHAPIHVSVARQHWQSHLQINLAIEMFLRNVTWHRFHWQRPGPGAGPNTPARLRRAAAEPARTIGRSTTPPLAEAQARLGIRQAPAGAWSPLVRIVKRLERMADVDDAAPRLMPRVGQRLLHAPSGHERVEELQSYRHRPGTLLQRPPAPHISGLVPGESRAASPVAYGRAPAAMGQAAFDAAGEVAVVRNAPPGARALAPAVDVEALTERVVREIDRRIVAHRERLGRPY